jgi:hypothetical protein
MKIQPILLIIFFTVTSSIAFGSDDERATLNRFLFSKNADERQQAFNVITSNKDKYRNDILAELQVNTKKPNKTPDALLYIAAIIKDERYIDSLSKLINNASYSEEHCIYSCPIVFSLVVFSSFTNYSSPLLDDKLTAVHDYRSELDHVNKISLEPEIAYKYGSGPAFDPLLKEIEPLPIKEVIKIAGPTTKDGLRRLAAATVLHARTTDDKYLNDLYWLAISNVPNDASGEYRYSIHWAIYKAETYRKQKK